MQLHSCLWACGPDCPLQQDIGTSIDHPGAVVGYHLSHPVRKGRDGIEHLPVFWIFQTRGNRRRAAYTAEVGDRTRGWGGCLYGSPFLTHSVRSRSNSPASCEKMTIIGLPCCCCPFRNMDVSRHAKFPENDLTWKAREQPWTWEKEGDLAGQGWPIPWP